MARILGLDFGTKRTGVAVTDELQIIASGLTTVETPNIISFLKEFLKNEEVELFVVGQPKNLKNEVSQSASFVESMLKKLNESFPEVAIVEVDERFTSKMAFQTMIDSGLSKKQRQNKELVDEISATIILQSYLYSR